MVATHQDRLAAARPVTRRVRHAQLRRVACWIAYRIGVTNGEYARYWTQRKRRSGI